MLLLMRQQQGTREADGSAVREWFPRNRALYQIRLTQTDLKTQQK